MVCDKLRGTLQCPQSIPGFLATCRKGHMLETSPTLTPAAGHHLNSASSARNVSLKTSAAQEGDHRQGQHHTIVRISGKAIEIEVASSIAVSRSERDYL